MVADDQMPLLEITVTPKADGVELNIPDNMIARVRRNCQWQ